MRSTDFRNATFESIRKDLEGLRLQVYEAWVQHGPCTTRQLAQRCGVDLWTVRPRTTELLQLGLLSVTCDVDGVPERRAPAPNAKKEGVYQVTPVEQWNRWRAQQVNTQLKLI